MALISYEDYKEIISYLQEGGKTPEETSLFFESKGILSAPLIKSLTEIMSGNTKKVTALDKIFAEEQTLTTEDLLKYSENVSLFIENHGFAAPLLVKEFPTEDIPNFDRNRWASITKSKIFDTKNPDPEVQRIILSLAGVYGAFEPDQEVENRKQTLITELATIEKEAMEAGGQEGFKEKAKEKMQRYSGLEISYDPSFYRFIKENSEFIENFNLSELQSQWKSISKCVDIKTPENIQRYLEISQAKKGNEFETYMAYHNIPESKIAKYRLIYDQMIGRTETSLPTFDGKTDKGYSYEMLDFDDIRVMRFGETIKCCQRLGNVAETSMINTAIEATSRVVIISDEKGKPVAGSMVTHKIDKEGRSYVCFDSIEVNAAKLPVKAVEYSKTLKKLSKLVKRGEIPNSEIDTIEEYFNTHPTQKHITKKDIEALKINKKIMEAYKTAADEMIVQDEQKRDEQLAKGEITQEEHDRLLIKNGRITVGRNPVSMYLGDLPEVPKKEMEILPAIQKDKSLYKKAHKATGPDLVRKVVRGMTLTGIGVGAAMLPVNPIAGGLFLAWGGIGSHVLKRKKAHGQTYSDAIREQRSLYDGRTDKVPAITDPEQIKELQKKLVYSQYEVVSPSTEKREPGDFSDVKRIADLDVEQRKKFRRLREAVGQEDFTEQDQDKYVIGNAQNWCATITRDGANLAINDIAMLNSFGFGRKQAMLADAQVQLMGSLQALASRAESMSFETENSRVNQYLGKHIDVKSKGDAREQDKAKNPEIGEIGH